jgi:putative transposase
MNRKTVLVPGEFYHVYNRGTDKRKIFLSEKDRERFLALLYLANGTNPVRMDNLRQQGFTLLALGELDRGVPLVDIGAYCLMPNHFHLLLQEKEEGGISRFMQKLTTGYTMYFNKRHERSGTLLQGVFKSTHVKDDRQLAYLLSYIHLNPVKLIEPKWKESGIRDRKGAERFLETYRHSSYLYYCGKNRPESCIITPSILPTQAESPQDFKKNVSEWLQYKNEE